MIKLIFNIVGPVSILLLVLYFLLGGEENSFSFALELIVLCSVVSYFDTLFSKSKNERLPWE
jgi:hypothetical protein